MSSFVLFLILSCISLSKGSSNCPLMGPTFPKPKNLSSSTALQAAFTNLTAHFTGIDTDNSTGTFTNSYSIQVFSMNDLNPIFEHYHTAQNLESLNSTGVTDVDANTVYRLGSLTKIFTVYTLLVEAGDIHFNDPVTDFVPELAALAANVSSSSIMKVAWEDITLGNLASHMAGISADTSLVGELSWTLYPDAVSDGFPPLPPADIPICGDWPLCNRTEFFAVLANIPPGFRPAETPSYSNMAFQILSYALESITGRSFQSSLESKVLEPLNLTHTSYSVPNDSVGVIPGTLEKTEWSSDLGEETPAGGMYSSASDISALGRAILNSTLLTPLQTRRWLKPAILTSDYRETVGYPWGIRRIFLNSDQPYNLLTAYNKAGHIGSYSSLFSLIPDYDIGFVILVAGDSSLGVWPTADIMANTIFPAMDQTARDEAQLLYAGNYSSSALNSSLSLSTNSKPGIGIDSWISNGTDMMAIAGLIYTGTSSPTFGARLYPTDLQSTDGSQKVFKAVFEDLSTQATDNTYTAGCGTWIGPTGYLYGGLPLDEFIFTVDSTGKAATVEPVALRVSLERME